MQETVSGFSTKFDSLEVGFCSLEVGLKEVKNDVHRQKEDFRAFKSEVDLKWSQIEKDVLKAIEGAALKQLQDKVAALESDVALLKAVKIKEAVA